MAAKESKVTVPVVAPNAAAPRVMHGTIPVLQGIFLKRVKEGYNLVFATVPESLIQGYKTKQVGPHNMDMLNALMRQWSEGVGFGTIPKK